MSGSEVAVLGTPGFVRDAKRFDDETLLKVLGANSGNLMFQYAAATLIDEPKKFISLAEIPYSDITALQNTKMLVMPAANHLRLGADWSGLNGYLANANRPLVVLGLGAQSPKIGGEMETIQALKADQQVRRLADIIRERAALVTVRGPYSETVCHELGVENVKVFGCPSALISRDPALGAKMEAQILATASRETPAKIAITAAAPFEIDGDERRTALEQKLLGWMAEGDGVYVQQSGGVSAIRAANGGTTPVDMGPARSIQRILGPEMNAEKFWTLMKAAGRFYVGAPDWIKEMDGMDLAIGSRLHGNMAAIATGTPGVLIAHDSRTGELGQTMHLPTLAYDDVMSAATLQEALGRIEFSGQAFDEWRAGTADQFL